MTSELRWWGSVLADRTDAIDDTGATPAEGETYALLPGRNDPRAVVDVESDAAMRDSLARMASRSLPGVARHLVPLGGRLAGRLAPSWSIDAPGEVPTLRQHLSAVLGRNVRLSIAVGPPRPNRKPVVRCFDAEDMIAVAKLGPEPHTAALVRNEGGWLATFDQQPLESATTPTLLHRGSYGHSELLVMSVLPLASEVPGSVEDMPNEVLDELVERTGVSAGIEQSGFWAALDARLTDVTEPVVKAAIARIPNHPGADDLSVTFWHGDWSPWNVGRTKDGSLCVWDWERASSAAPSGFDTLHLHHQYGHGLDAGIATLTTAGLSSDLASLIRSLYLLELVARHNEARATDTDRHRATLDLLATAMVG